jgi:hypothetical protein
MTIEERVRNHGFRMDIHRSPYDSRLKEAIMRQKKRMQLARRAEVRQRSNNTIEAGGINVVHGYAKFNTDTPMSIKDASV